MQDFYATIINNAKKDFTKDKTSLVKTLLLDDKKCNVKSIAYKASKTANRGDVITTFYLDNANNLKKHVYVKTNGLIVLDYFKKESVKLINLDDAKSK